MSLRMAVRSLPRLCWTVSWLGIVLLGACLASCGKAKRIEGRVVSESGEPLAGVKVQVVNSAFMATTNQSGRYSLDYAPGTLQVAFAQDGRFTDTLNLSLSQKSYFPAAEVRLLRIPAEPGVVWVSPKGYVALSAAEVQAIVVRPGRTIFDREVQTFKPAGEPTIVSDRAPRFLDTTPAGLALVKLDEGGKIATASYGSFGLDSNVESDRCEETVRRRAETCVERTAPLEPGDYVFTTFSSSMVRKPTGTCYYFRVVPEAAASPTAPTGSGVPAAGGSAAPVSYAGHWTWDAGEEGSADWVLRQSGSAVEGRLEWQDGSEQSRWAEVRGSVSPDGSITLDETKAGVGDAVERATGRYSGRMDASGMIVGTQSFTDSNWKNEWKLTRSGPQ